MNEKIIFLVLFVHGILSSPSNKTETNDYDPNYDDGDQWIFREENSYKKSVEHIAQELYFGFAEELENNFAFSQHFVCFFKKRFLIAICFTCTQMPLRLYRLRQ